MTIVTNETSTEKGIRLKNYQQMEPKICSLEVFQYLLNRNIWII
jgi:hypothetical protein